jgi:hypothetical protein
MPYLFSGGVLNIEDEPRLKDGILWVPLRKLGEAIGGTADWVSPNHVAVLYLNQHIATFTVGEDSVDVDGTKIQLQAAPFVESGETWVPVRFFEKGLNYTLKADPPNGIVDLTPPG